MNAEIRPLREVVREHIILILQISHWRTQLAADRLGMSQRHLYNKAKEYGIDLKAQRLQATLRFRAR